MRFRIGTRGSALARTQAEYAVDLLAGRLPGAECAVHIVRSLGDASPTVPLDRLGAQGVFTQALEQALADGSIDVAVHSAKDLPSSLSDRFALAAITAREDPRDCLVSRYGVSLADLPLGATVGTGSPRRISQLRLLRPDLRFVPMRGNVDSRRAAALEGKLDAVILAVAGLSRLGLLDDRAVALDIDQCLPQAGQGALALEVLAHKRVVLEAVRLVDCADARVCVEAERAVLAGLAAGCQAPVAAHATLIGTSTVRLRAYAGAGEGPVLHADRSAPARQAASLGLEVARELRARGADDILAAARHA